MQHKVMRHAYLIMAHNQFDFLEMLLKDIDDERNDIFLHIDKKSKLFSEEKAKGLITRGRLHFIPRKRINWGGYSIVNCILELLENAVSQGEHSFYHLLVGSEFPIKSQDEIHAFFDTHCNNEFIAFDEFDKSYIDRVKYYWPFVEFGRRKGKIAALEYIMNVKCIQLQKRMGVDLTKNIRIDFKKGNMNWSVTDELARYIVSQADILRKIYRHRFCCDEVFIHTLIYNNEFFKKRVYCWHGGTAETTFRMCQWDRPDNTYHIDDLQTLLDSGCFFARKLVGDEGKQIAKALIENRVDS